MYLFNDNFSTDLIIYSVRFQVLSAASVKMIAFPDKALCSLVEVHRRFRGAYYTAQHSRRLSSSDYTALDERINL
jgi:hypothetical protein